jgi:hypothetical protein
LNYHLSPFLVSLSLLFFSACSTIQRIIPAQKEEPPIERLKEEVNQLDSHNKRLIYQSIKNDIQQQLLIGDKAYKNAHYHDALQAYELVNYYEGSSTISKQKLHNIKIKIDKNSATHYKKAQQYLSKDKHKALYELNIVMMNNPNYKDTTTLYNSIYNEQEVKLFINTLTDKLEEKLLHYNGSYKELYAIKETMQNLQSYQYKNKTLQKAQELLEKEKNALAIKAEDLYKAKKLMHSKEVLVKIRSLDPQDKNIQKRINYIVFKQSKAKYLRLAQKMLQENNYSKSSYYAEKTLQLDKNNKEAKKILKEIEKQKSIALKQYLAKGIHFYNNKNLDKAKKYYLEALKIDKNNATALIYIKKIQRQLQTIQSLQ